MNVCVAVPRSGLVRLRAHVVAGTLRSLGASADGRRWWDAPLSPGQSAVEVPQVASPPAIWDQPPAASGPPAVGRLQIPNLGIDAAVEPVLVDAKGSMAVPSGPGRVGWYSAGPRPGAAGDAVLDGHLDTAAGSAVFARLGSLRPGAAIVVLWGAGKSLHFTVSSLRLYDFDAHPDGLFATAGPPRI